MKRSLRGCLPGFQLLRSPGGDFTRLYMISASGILALYDNSPSAHLRGSSAGNLKPICKSTGVFLLSETRWIIYLGKIGDTSASLKMILFISQQSQFPQSFSLFIMCQSLVMGQTKWVFFCLRVGSSQLLFHVPRMPEARLDGVLSSLGR